jgi:hypothetical protein
MRMAGQVAVVTGAGRGIGRAIGRRLAAEGAALVLAARSTAEIAAAAAEIGGAGGRAEAVATDVRDEASVAALVHAALERHGRIDVLVAAAGVAAFAEASAITLADWDQMMTVNLRGAFLSIRAVLPAMMARRRGTIIAVGSMVTGRTLPGSGAYTASKYGLLGFCRGAGGRAVGGRGGHAPLGRDPERPRSGPHDPRRAGRGGRSAHGDPGHQRRPRGADLDASARSVVAASAASSLTPLSPRWPRASLPRAQTRAMLPAARFARAPGEDSGARPTRGARGSAILEPTVCIHRRAENLSRVQRRRTRC